ncbi:hypothetical protein [Actinoplanes regularis]|uniref:Uncharacterized protein n=1 Tax=Actinoplanes regularis TaxID=52697 RepID=A0A239IUD7_9ACTN|nr:hypothetical protein [Actinoplanes regularis]SNS97197.1 hypothetical protein SAMN06264365_13114 [Actinoplanes regularis]
MKVGLLICGVCGRWMEGHWVNQRAGIPLPAPPHHRERDTTVDESRRVYWSQARIVEEATGADGGALTGFADAGPLAAWLRACDTVLVCGTNRVAIEDPASDRSQPDVMPTGEALANGQLILPMTTGRAPPSGLKKPIGKRETKPPSRSRRM